MTEGKDESHPNRTSVLGAVGFIIALAALISYDLVRQTVHLPAALRYVPTNASAIVFTPKLAATWDEIAHHIRPIFKQPRAENLSALIGDSKEWLATACVAPVSGADLNRYGIDSYRGAAVASIGQLQSELSEIDVLVVLPVTNEVEFSQTLASFQLGGGEVDVDGILADKEPIGFRIRRPTDVESGKLCALSDGQVIEIGAQAEIVANADLYFVPGWFEPSIFDLECVALYENGEEGACTCKLYPGDFDVDSDDCLEPVIISPDKDEVYDFEVGSISVDGLEESAFEGIAIPDSDLKVIFAEERWAIITNSDEALAAALAEPERNLAYHRNSDTLRSLLASFYQSESNTQSTSSSLAGSIRIPWIYSTSPVTFNLEVTPARLSLELDLDLPHGSITLFDRLTRSSANDQASEFVPYGAKVALALADTHLAYYIRYLFKYVDGAFDRAESNIGHFAEAVRMLSDADSFEALTLIVPELREGVPELALVAKLNNPEVAQQVILDLKRQLRRDRDVEILEQAYGRYTRINNKPPADVSTLYEVVGEPVNGDHYLVPEPHDTWASYSIEGDEVVLLELPNDIFSTDSYVLDSKLIDATGGMASTSISLHYLSPPVTDNDFQYLYDDLREDETDQLGAESEVLKDRERDALRADVNRLCAAYSSETGSLWIGSNVEVLKNIFRSGAHKRQSGRYSAAKEIAGKSDTPKGALFAHTGWVLDQALAHPDEKIVEWANQLIDLSDYKQLLVTITAREDRNGIEARIELLK